MPRKASQNEPLSLKIYVLTRAVIAKANPERQRRTVQHKPVADAQGSLHSLPTARV